MKKHSKTGHHFSGVSEMVGRPVDKEGEPIHKGLARGAFAKAAERFRDGTITDDEFHGHIKQAHSRLSDPMPGAMPMPAIAFAHKSSVERTKHIKRHGRKGPKHGI